MRTSAGDAALPYLQAAVAVTKAQPNLERDGKMTYAYLDAAYLLYENVHRKASPAEVGHIYDEWMGIASAGLKLRPEDSGILSLRSRMLFQRAQSELRIGQIDKGHVLLEQARHDAETTLRKDPENRLIVDYLAYNYWMTANAFSYQGKPDQMFSWFEKGTALYAKHPPSRSQAGFMRNYSATIAYHHAEAGNLSDLMRITSGWQIRTGDGEPVSAGLRREIDMDNLFAEARSGYLHAIAGRPISAAAVARLRQRAKAFVATTDKSDSKLVGRLAAIDYQITSLEAIQAELDGEHGAAADKWKLMVDRLAQGTLRDRARVTLDYSLALVKAGRPREAAALLPLLKSALAEQLDAGSDDIGIRRSQARLLFTQAHLTPNDAPALLRQAGAELAQLPTPVQAYRSTRLLREQIQAAQRHGLPAYRPAVPHTSTQKRPSA